MNGEIICVGTELLLGNIVNTNARFLSEELAALGINIYNQSVVGDNEERIKQELGAALRRSQIVILTGGLGPTEDDMTKECVASYFSLPLIEDAETKAQIEAYFERTGRTMTKSNYKQALMPKGCHIFKNDVGTAPGCAVEHSDNTVIILPGPPTEMEYMFKKYVKPYLEKKSRNTIVSHKVRIFGESESKIENQIKHLTKLHNPTVAPYASEGEVYLRVTASSANAAAADALCKPVIGSITDILGDCVYGVDCDELQNVVVEMLKDKKLKIATAESCTAGMLSSMITEVSGSSEIFEFGISAYANRVKVNALGVPEEIIARHGAVSEHTAAYMAMGVRKLSGADLGIGITGVAGPGASESKPVGLVYIALADRHNIWIRKTTLGHGRSEREKVRRNSAKTALDLVRRYLCSLPSVLPGGFAIGTSPIVLTEQPHIFAQPQKVAEVRSDAANAKGFTDLELAQMISSVARNDHYEPATKEDALEYAKNQSEYLAFVDEKDDIDYPAVPTFKEKLLSLFKKKHKSDAAQIESDFVTEADLEEQVPTGPDTAAEKANGAFISEGAEAKPEAVNTKTDSGVKKSGRIKSKLLKFLRSLLPWKGDKPAEMIRKLIFIIALVALIISSLYIINYFHESYAQKKIGEEVRDAYNSSNTNKDDSGVYDSFEEVLRINSDTKAWITIPGTAVNDPIVLGPDNDFYLTHNIHKEASRYGTVYFDAACEITAEKVSQNLVIYGHEMKDGQMFGTLKRYKDLNFYKQNPVFTMRTLYNDASYKIFSIFITNSRPEHDNGNVFDYRKINFTTQDEFLEFTSQLTERSIINTGVDIIEGDEIVTLSTCATDFDDARLVIVARKVRADEESSIDMEAVSVNENPHYPQIYYDKKGIQNPYSDTTTPPNTNSSSDIPTSSTPPSSDESGSSSQSPTSSNVVSVESGSEEPTQGASSNQA